MGNYPDGFNGASLWYEPPNTKECDACGSTLDADTSTCPFCGWVDADCEDWWADTRDGEEVA